MAAKLHYYYGAMNSTKTSNLITTYFNYKERGLTPIAIKPLIDTKSSKIQSRPLGEMNPDWVVAANDSITELFKNYALENSKKPNALILDEAQFFTPQQIDEVYDIVVEENVAAIAYGLRADFRTHAFPGAIRLFELAHEMTELKTMCRCDSKAIFNARKINGKFVNEGVQVAVEGEEFGYESLCSSCYFEKVGHPKTNL